MSKYHVSSDLVSKLQNSIDMLGAIVNVSEQSIKISNTVINVKLLIQLSGIHLIFRNTDFINDLFLPTCRNCTGV